MRKIIKWGAIVLVVLAAIIATAGIIIHQPRPQGQTGAAAEALAQKMLNAVDKTAWDTTRYVRWTFAGMHHYVWDKTEDQVAVQWDDYRVLLRTRDQQGRAWQAGKPVTGKELDRLLARAWNFFCNDSFWLNAPVKALDPGTERRVVRLEDGEEALLVSYTSGGVTPGDSYLWLLDEAGRPRAWKMWVKIIPVGGVQSSWSDWEELPTGAWVATTHETAGLTVRITDLAAGNSLEAIGLTSLVD